MDDHDGVLGERGEVHDLLAQQVGEKPGAHVSDVGGTLAEDLLVGGGEHVVVHLVGLAHGLLGAHAGIDGVGDHLLDAVILGELDVGAHDGGRLFADGLGHTLDLCVGLLDELGDGARIAGLLRIGILGNMRGKRKVRIHRNAGDANSDTVRRINTFEHVSPSSRPQRGS